MPVHVHRDHHHVIIRLLTTRQRKPEETQFFNHSNMQLLRHYYMVSGPERDSLVDKHVNIWVKASTRKEYTRRNPVTEKEKVPVCRQRAIMIRNVRQPIVWRLPDRTLRLQKDRTTMSFTTLTRLPMFSSGKPSGEPVDMAVMPTCLNRNYEAVGADGRTDAWVYMYTQAADMVIAKRGSLFLTERPATVLDLKALIVSMCEKYGMKDDIRMCFTAHNGEPLCGANAHQCLTGNMGRIPPSFVEEELLSSRHELATVHLGPVASMVMHDLSEYGYFGVALSGGSATQTVHFKRFRQELLTPIASPAAMATAVRAARNDKDKDIMQHVDYVFEQIKKKTKGPLAMRGLVEAIGALLHKRNSCRGLKKMSWPQYGAMVVVLVHKMFSKRSYDKAAFENVMKTVIEGLPEPLCNYVSFANQVLVHNRCPTQSFRDRGITSRVSNTTPEYVKAMMSATYVVDHMDRYPEEQVSAAVLLLRTAAVQCGATIRQFGKYGAGHGRGSKATTKRVIKRDKHNWVGHNRWKPVPHVSVRPRDEDSTNAQRSRKRQKVVE